MMSSALTVNFSYKYDGAFLSPESFYTLLISSAFTINYS